MAKKHTKEQLLATVADDNEFIDKYLMIINANEDVPVDKKSNKGTGRQIHHIIPRLYFRKNKKVVDDSETNLISLTLGEHFLAHYYLWRGCKQEYKGKCACAVHFMIKCHEREIFKGFTHDEEAAKLFAQALNDNGIKEDRIEAMSGEKNPMYGTHCNAGESNGMYGKHEDHPFFGKHHSEETKSKMREKAAKRDKKVYYYDHSNNVKPIKDASKKYKEYKASGGKLDWNEFQKLCYK